MPNVARIIRSNTLSLREMPFVEAARAIGMSEMRIAISHVLPNTLAPLIVLATAQLGSAILVEAALSFLGLGMPEPHPSWGRMLSESAAEYVRTAPWLVIFPGVAISAVVFGTNLLGDAMRDILDPRQRILDGSVSGSRRVEQDAALEPAAGERVLEVEDLQTYFYTRAGLVKAVDGVSFSLGRGETLAIVGESGCGKSVTALSLMRLVADPPGRIVGGSVRLDGVDLVAPRRGDHAQHPRQRDLDDLPGADDLAQSGDDHRPADRARRSCCTRACSRKAALARAIEMLQLVGIPEPQQRVKEYPHQLSGGMRQRAMIAMALACNPKVLIADEPTSALDVTIQAQILDLIAKLQRELGTAVILITHDLGVVAETAERVIVMYAGRKVEEATVERAVRHGRCIPTRAG